MVDENPLFDESSSPSVLLKVLPSKCTSEADWNIDVTGPAGCEYNCGQERKTQMMKVAIKQDLVTNILNETRTAGDGRGSVSSKVEKPDSNHRE